MAVQVTLVTVTNTAVELTASDADAVPGQSLLFTAPATPVVYLGPAGVTSATGYPLAAGQVVTATLAAGDRLFAVVASGSVVVPVLRQGV